MCAALLAPPDLSPEDKAALASSGFSQVPVSESDGLMGVFIRRFLNDDARASIFAAFDQVTRQWKFRGRRRKLYAAEGEQTPPMDSVMGVVTWMNVEGWL